MFMDGWVGEIHRHKYGMNRRGEEDTEEMEKNTTTHLDQSHNIQPTEHADE